VKAHTVNAGTFDVTSNRETLTRERERPNVGEKTGTRDTFCGLREGVHRQH
jgi:hypothetical protein